MKIGLFIDTGNLYHNVRTDHQAKVDYAAVLAYVEDIGTIEVANAYGMDMGRGSDNFRTKLGELGYHTSFRRRSGNPNVELVLDAIGYLDKVDCLVLCTSDGGIQPLVEIATGKDTSVIVIGSGISADIKGATCIEIPPSFLLKETR